MNDFWYKKKVFITGGTGFIGTHLVKKLTKMGADIFLLVHKKRPDNKDIIYHCADIVGLDRDFEINLKWFSPEVIFHLAAQPLVSDAMRDGKGTLDTNVKGTYDFLDSCKNLKSLKSFVHISTDKVYGNVSPIHDYTVANATHHPYNASKLAGDAIARMYSNFYGIPTVVVRNANVYGAGDGHLDRIIPRTIVNAIKGEKPVIRGDGSNTRDYIHVSEVVEGYLRAAALPYKEKLTVLNLGGFNHPVIRIVDTILSKLGRVDLACAFEEQWNGEIPNQHIVNEQAKELIRWNPKIDIEQGLDLTIPWYKDKYGKR